MLPSATRPTIDAAYGVPEHEDNLLSWGDVELRMQQAHTYWLSTVSRSGEPHTRPIDGVWLRTALYFSGSSKSRWFKNVVERPLVCLNLEDGIKAVIVHGHVEHARVELSFAEELAALSNIKYDIGATAKTYLSPDVLILRPQRVFAWNLLYEDATRFVFA